MDCLYLWNIQNIHIPERILTVLALAIVCKHTGTISFIILKVSWIIALIFKDFSSSELLKSSYTKQSALSCTFPSFLEFCSVQKCQEQCSKTYNWVSLYLSYQISLMLQISLNFCHSGSYCIVNKARVLDIWPLSVLYSSMEVVFFFDRCMFISFFFYFNLFHHHHIEWLFISSIFKFQCILRHFVRCVRLIRRKKCNGKISDLFNVILVQG